MGHLIREKHLVLLDDVGKAIHVPNYLIDLAYLKAIDFSILSYVLANDAVLILVIVDNDGSNI